MLYKLTREDFTAWLLDAERKDIECVGTRWGSRDCVIAKYIAHLQDEDVLIWVGVKYVAIGGTIHTVVEWAQQFIRKLGSEYSENNMSPSECLDILGRIPHGV